MSAWSRLIDWLIGRPEPVRQYPYISAAPDAEAKPIVQPSIEPAPAAPAPTVQAPVAAAPKNPKPTPQPVAPEPPARKVRIRTSAKAAPVSKPKPSKARR